VDFQLSADPQEISLCDDAVTESAQSLLKLDLDVYPFGLFNASPCPLGLGLGAKPASANGGRFVGRQHGGV
jgi:hypothetical protein